MRCEYCHRTDGTHNPVCPAYEPDERVPGIRCDSCGDWLPEGSEVFVVRDPQETHYCPSCAEDWFYSQSVVVNDRNFFMEDW